MVLNVEINIHATIAHTFINLHIKSIFSTLFEHGQHRFTFVYVSLSHTAYNLSSLYDLKTQKHGDGLSIYQSLFKASLSLILTTWAFERRTTGKKEGRKQR